MAVAHEPLHEGYQARKILQFTAAANDAPQLPPEVVGHMEAIEARLATHACIECGHPSWSTIPCLAARFRGRVRIIHLVRHPVPTSWSWLALQARLDAPWMRLRYEDLFHGDGLERLLEFLQLPPRETILHRRRDVVDAHRSLLPTCGDWRVVRDHPRAVAMAQALGYAIDAVDEAALERRYACPHAAPAG